MLNFPNFVIKIQEIVVEELSSCERVNDSLVRQNILWGK
jgi:hypothetical protein